MRKFFKILGIFIVVLYVCALILDGVITYGLRHFNTRMLSTWNDIYDGKIDADIIALGSSRFERGINTYILDSTLSCNSYNFGLDGHPIDMQIVRYNTYRRFNKKPKIVFINADFLSTLGNSADMEFEREQFFPFFGDDSLISVVAKCKKFTYVDRYVPLCRYYGYHRMINFGIFYYFGYKDPVEGKDIYKGYIPQDQPWSRKSLDMDTIFSATTDTASAKLLDNFIEQLKDDNIQVVLIKSPVYISLREKFYNIEFSDSVYDYLASKYNVPLLDFYFNEICRDSTSFYDPSHLNRKGSIIFTKQLCDSIVSKGIYP